MANGLLVLVVSVHVRPENVEAFRAATVANARGSGQEPGCLRFDVVQELEDPARFLLYEVYRDAAAHAAHRETAHFQTWRDTVAPMMAETRTSKKYVVIHPEDAQS